MDFSLIEIILCAQTAAAVITALSVLVGAPRLPLSAQLRTVRASSCPLQLYIFVALQARHAPLGAAYRPIERNLIRSARLYLSTLVGGAAGGARCTSERAALSARRGQSGRPTAVLCQRPPFRRAKDATRHLQQTLIQLGVVYRELFGADDAACVSKWFASSSDSSSSNRRRER